MQLNLSGILAVAAVLLSAMMVRGQLEDFELTSPGIRALTELAEEYDRLRTAYWAALQEAETDDERQQARQLAPDDELIPRFLALEEKHRGTNAGLLILRFVNRNAARYGDPDAVASRARMTVCERLARDYLAHPNLDACLDSFDGGVRYEEIEPLLRTVARKSPHAHVRAAATYQLAQWLYAKSQLPGIRARVQQRLEKAAPEERERMETWIESLHLLGDIDPETARDDAISVAGQVIDEYYDARRPRRIASGPAHVLLERADDNTKTPAHPTYGELAGRLLFEIEQLAIGSAAPDISGTDAEGTPFKLSDYLGRVVVIMFSADWCGPCKAMYPENRSLLEKFADQPVAILGVMADQQVDTVRVAHLSGEITWRCWWDGEEGPIAAQWNIGGWPTVFVLDHRGIIRHHTLKGDELEAAVAGLLKARSDDPAADKLLQNHPVPDIPILKQAQQAATGVTE